MLKRFFEAKSFRFHVPKVIQVRQMIIFEYFGWKIMYVVVYVLCMYCMYCMYVLYVCIVCMYYMCYMYVIYVCKASWPSRPPGAKVHGKT